MKITAAFPALLAAVLLASCATQTKEQLAAVRAAGVSAGLAHKLEHWRVIEPEDIIELHRRHVNDAIALRQLDRVGVNYVVDKGILRQLRKAGVSDTVLTAVVTAGRRYEEQFHPYYGGWRGPYGYPYGPYYGDFGWGYGGYPYAFGPGLYGPGFRGGPGFGGGGFGGGPGGGGRGGGGGGFGGGGFGGRRF